jgi:secreted Zn-dependent insulinase-like peptidase
VLHCSVGSWVTRLTLSATLLLCTTFSIFTVRADDAAAINVAASKAASQETEAPKPEKKSAEVPFSVMKSDASAESKKASQDNPLTRVLGANDLFALTNESEITQQLAIFAVTKSERDARQYRYLMLNNKLRVLLISDPHAEKAAAALDVHVGHNQNPSARPGLAHFLEHMLFLGTEKYPQAGEYQAFISQHGGRYNAYTAPEHTNYFFDIDSDQLAPALDRFAQFFIAPLFDPDYIERERNAVHSEYRARIKDDTRRTLDVYRELMNPAHPLSGFSVGNLETLANTEDLSLRDELLAFYQTYYSADLMALVVLGREPLDELQRMVLPRFGLIAQRETSLPISYPALFSEEFLPANVVIQPEKELRQLSFLFPIPNSDEHYRKKPFHYIAHLLGHEGEGSLLAFLKQLGWAESLSAGIGLQSRHDGLFYVTINLTEKGLRATDQIPVVLSHVIKQLELRGLKDWRYHELQQMAEIDFRFQEKSPPMDSVRALAQAMHTYAPEDVLQANYLYTEYDEKLIRTSLSYLRDDNLLMALIAPDAKTTNNSAYYQTPYAVAPLVPMDDAEVKVSVRKRLFFPEANIFIPSRLAVKSQPLLPGSREAGQRGVRESPQRVMQQERVTAWFQQDQVFDVPKSHIHLRLKLPLVARDAAGAAQAHLFAALVQDQLNEFAYPARLAGLQYSLNANARGLDIEIAGYSSRQGLLLNNLADAIRKSRFTEERFTLLKAELIRGWRNQNKNSPYQVLLPQIPALQFEPYWSEQTLGAALEEKTYTEFQRFSARLLHDAQLDALFYGNLFRQEAIKLTALAEHQLLGTRTTPTPVPARVFQLQGGDKPWLYQHPLDHTDNIVLLYVQGLADTPQDAAHMQLVRQILQPLFFDRLRTERQLGYVVSVFPLALRTLEGSVFVVQSPTTNEQQLMQEIDQFLVLQQDVLADKLAENQRALVHRLQEPPRSLAEQADRLWESVLVDDVQFSRRQELAAAVAAVTPESLLAYYRQSMLDRGRRLWLSSTRTALEDYRLVEDIPAYQRQLKSFVYP